MCSIFYIVPTSSANVLPARGASHQRPQSMALPAFCAPTPISVRPALPKSHPGVGIETPHGPGAARNAISPMGQR